MGRVFTGYPWTSVGFGVGLFSWRQEETVKAILIANPKGGSGKTTLSTNIAGYLASRGHRVAMLDLDRQKSATLWLANRPPHLPGIELMLSEVEKSTPVEWLVIDSPAGLHGKNLDHALKLVHKVIVPIAPSAFDIQASRDFLEVLHHEKTVRKGKIFVGVVGMRMDSRTRAALTLEQFLKGLDLPVLAYLRETQAYVSAAFEGKTLFDLPPSLAQRELEQWEYLLGWLEHEA
jgi:chromosome partitioning protein